MSVVVVVVVIVVVVLLVLQIIPSDLDVRLLRLLH